MLRIFIVVLAIVALFLTMQPLQWVVADVPPVPSHISIQPQKGVTAFDVQIAHRAVAFSMQETEKKLGLSLNHPVTILLTPDAKTYAQVLRDEAGLRQEAALAQAAFTSGSSQGSKVIVNIGEIDLYNDALFIVAHEIAHQSQLEAVEDITRLNWLTEGIADWVAAQAVAANMGESVNSDASPVSRYRQDWLTAVAEAPQYPRLQDLDSRSDWLASVQVYGPVIPYRTSALGVLRLAEMAGIHSFHSYFLLRSTGESAESAFVKSFSMPLDVFEAHYADWLQASLNKRSQ